MSSLSHSSAAVRANDLAKGLRTRLRNVKTAKLFAKHLKVQEQVQVLKEFQALAVGTPNRIKKLAELGALSLSATQLIVLDMQRDQKQFHLLSLPGVAQDVAAFLKAQVLPELPNGKLKIALF